MADTIVTTHGSMLLLQAMVFCSLVSASGSDCPSEKTRRYWQVTQRSRVQTRSGTRGTAGRICVVNAIKLALVH